MNWQQPSKEMLNAFHDYDLIVLDSYLADETLIDTLTTMNAHVAFIDDYVHRDYEKGLVMDWTVGSEIKAYPVKHDNVTYLLGSQYCVLREPFWKGNDRPVSEEVERLLVSFGGSDIRSMTIPAVTHIHRMYPAIEIHAVLGPGACNRTTQPLLQDNKVCWHSSLDAANIKLLMDSCDLAICGGGQTLYELASCGLPPLVIEFIENQREDICGFADIGFAEFIGRWNDKDIMERILQALDTLKSPVLRSKRARIGKQAIDGKGAMRVAQELLSYTKFVQ